MALTQQGETAAPYIAKATPEPDIHSKSLIAELEASGCKELHLKSVAQVRAWFDEVVHALALDPVPDLPVVEDLQVPVTDGQIAIRLYRPEPKGKALPALVCLHASGYVFGDLDTLDSFCRLMAAGAHCIVVAVDYRRAPEHKFPGPLEDCYAATLWISRHAEELGIDPKRLAVGGDSSGGTMATVMTQLAVERGEPNICHQLLWYPGTGSLGPTQSSEDYAEGYFLENSLQSWSVKQYLNDTSELTDPRVQPLRYDDLSRMPPCYLMTAGFDPRRDDNAKYATKLEEAGVPVTFTCVESTIHGFLFLLGKLPVAREAVDQSIEYTRKMFSELA
jgi:acetyl esterase